MFESEAVNHFSTIKHQEVCSPWNGKQPFFTEEVIKKRYSNKNCTYNNRNIQENPNTWFSVAFACLVFRLFACFEVLRKTTWTTTCVTATAFLRLWVYTKKSAVVVPLPSTCYPAGHQLNQPQQIMVLTGEFAHPQAELRHLQKNKNNSKNPQITELCIQQVFVLFAKKYTSAPKQNTQHRC